MRGGKRERKEEEEEEEEEEEDEEGEGDGSPTAAAGPPAKRSRAAPAPAKRSRAAPASLKRDRTPPSSPSAPPLKRQRRAEAPRVDNAVLARVFGERRALSEYLERAAGVPGAAIRVPGDSDRYLEVLDGTLVCPSAAAAAADAPAYDPAAAAAAAAAGPAGLHAAVMRSVQRLVQTGTASVLANGYRRIRPGSSSGIDSLPFTHNADTNSVVTMITSTGAWRTLFSRVGEPLFAHLLLDCHLFHALPNRCYLQLTGRPVTDMVRKSRAAAVPPCSSASDSLVRGLNSARVQRASMLYADSLPAGAVGLPRSHPLNRFEPSSNGARRLLHEVFVAAGGPAGTLGSPALAQDAAPAAAAAAAAPAAAPAPASAAPPPRRDRPPRLPPRLQPLQDAFRAMIRSHRACPYRALLAQHCPLPAPLLDAAAAADPTQRTPTAASRSAGSHESPATVVSIGTASLLGRLAGTATSTPPDPPRPPPAPAPGAAEELRALAGSSCSHDQVAAFLRAACVRVVPRVVWGSKANARVFFGGINRLVCMRRHETLTVHSMVQGFRPSQCGWLRRGREARTARAGKAPRRAAASDAQKEAQLVARLFGWLACRLLMPLVRTCFFVTDTEGSRNRLVYYRRPVWERLRALAMSGLSAQYEAVSHPQLRALLGGRALGFGHLRLRPRVSGLRPIVNMARGGRLAPGRVFKPVNVVMRSAFDVLRFEKDRAPELLGSSVFGSAEVYAQLLPFLQSVRAAAGGAGGAAEMPPLYAATVDVRKCFDRIKADRVLRLVGEEVLTEGHYCLQSYSVAATKLGQVRNRYCRLVYPSGEVPDFVEVAAGAASATQDAVLADGVHRRFLTRDALLALLRQHVSDNVVRAGRQFYRQVDGIPQGSVLSALLCCMYIAAVEKRCLYPRMREILGDGGGRGGNPGGSLMLRHMDDFLFVSTSQAWSRAFVQAMHAGFPDHGVEVNAAKTRANFDWGGGGGGGGGGSSGSSSSSSSSSGGGGDFSPEIVSRPAAVPATVPTPTPTPAAVPGDYWLPWNGLLLHTGTLEVRADYARVRDTDLRDTLTVEYSSAPGEAMRRALKRFLQAKCHPLLFDARLNSRATVLLNVFQVVLFAAVKLCCYARELDLQRSVSQRHLHESVVEGVEYVFSITVTRFRFVEPAGGRFPLTRDHVMWLGLSAFVHVFTRKHSRFAPALALLRARAAAVREALGWARRVPGEFLPSRLLAGSPELVGLSY